MMLGTYKKQQNLAKNGLEAALGNKTPFRRHFAGQGAAKSSQKEAKLAAKGVKMEQNGSKKACKVACKITCNKNK